MAASAVLLAYWGRGGTIGGDELAYAHRLSEQPLGHAMLYPPPNGYLIAVPIAIYKLLFETAGLSTYVPYRGAAIALELLCAGLFYAVARLRVGDLWALPPTVLLLLFGFGGEQLLSAERMPGSIALAAGLGMLLALDRRTRRADVIALALLTVSLSSHPVGLAFAVAAAALVLLRPWAEARHSVWVFAVPVTLYAIWWLFLRPPATVPMQRGLSSIASFVGQSWTATTEAVTGLAGVVSEPIYTNVIGWIAAALVFGVVIGAIAARKGRLPSSFWAALAALLTLMLATAVTRGNAFLEMGRPPDAERYLYPQAFLFLLVLVELAGALRPAAWVKALVSTVLALGLIANVDRLITVGDNDRALAVALRAGYGSIEVAGSSANPGYRPFGLFFPDAGAFLSITRDFGSFAYSADELREAPGPTRLRADQALAQALGLRVAPAQPRPAGRRCTEVLPSGNPPRARRVITLPPGGALLAARRLDRVRLAVGRFADPPAVPLPAPPAATQGVLTIPRDTSAIPWRLAVDSGERVRVCGI
jgi:hypothetical protein